jgi:antitoxin component YwqK of YwqJK toxin-antitoxin module
MPEGKTIGTFRNYDSLGHLLLTGSFQNSRLHGDNTGYYPDGKIRHEYHFREGKKTGINYRYYPNGGVEIKEQVSISGTDIEEEYFTEDGIKISIRNFRNDKPHGRWIYYKEDGKTPALSENYENGKLHGVRTRYFPNGEKSVEEMYQFNLITGPVKNYYETGKLEWECIYRGNRMHGTYTGYYPQGGIKEQGEYVANRKHGIWKEFDQTGKIISTIRYTAGVPAKE